MDMSLVRNTSASYYQFQQSLDQYVYFSPHTKGGAGRAVKIHKDLFFPFFCMVDPNTHDGQNIIRQIENLRTTCTIVKQETGSGYANNPRQTPQHLDRLDKIESSFHKVLVIKNLYVYYRVSQEADDKAPSIYIMNIRQINRDTGSAPGLYEVAKASFGASSGPKKSTSSNVDGKNIYINGSSETVRQAMDNARYAADDNNVVLFYCPAAATDEFGILGRKEKSHLTNATVRELTDVFKQNQKLSRGVQWYVDGVAANILAEVIKKIPGDLNSHKFRLINPVTNTARLIEDLTNKKASFEGEFFKYDQNRASLMKLGIQKNDLLRAVRKLPAAKNYDIITRKNIMSSIEELCRFGEKVTKVQSKLDSMNQTFVQLLKAAGVYRK